MSERESTSQIGKVALAVVFDSDGTVGENGRVDGGELGVVRLR